jgi:hypothetical protein
MSEARDVLLAAMHDWNPDLHPRGHDGKFIEVLGWVNVKGVGGDEHAGGKRGQVQSIIPDKSNPGNPKIRVDFGKGDVKDVRPDQVSQAMETKARLDVKPSVGAKPTLPPPPPTVKAPPTPPPPSKFDPNADHLSQFKWGNPGPDGGKEAITHLSDSELDQVISDRERQSKDPSDTRWFTRNQEVMDLKIEKNRRTKFGGTNEGDPTKQIPTPPPAPPAINDPAAETKKVLSQEKGLLEGLIALREKYKDQPAALRRIEDEINAAKNKTLGRNKAGA